MGSCDGTAWLPSNNWVVLQFFDILFLPNVFIIPVERLGSISEFVWVERTTLVEPNPKSQLAHILIKTYPYLMQFQFLLAKVRHSCFALDRVFIVCSSDGHRSRTHRQNISRFTRKLEHGCTANTLWRATCRR
jgi:hypothetical protein